MKLSDVLLGFLANMLLLYCHTGRGTRKKEWVPNKPHQVHDFEDGNASGRTWAA